MMLLRENQLIRIECCFGNTVCSRSTNQSPALSQSELFLFIFQNFQSLFEKVYQKTFEFPRVT